MQKMLLTKNIRTAVSVGIISLILSGCLPFGGEPTLDGSDFDSFYQSYQDIANDLYNEDPQKGTSFEVAMMKIGAYKAFDPEKIDFSQGLVEVDVKSVLPMDTAGMLAAAYTSFGASFDGMTVEQVIATAGTEEQSAVQRFQARIDREIQSATQKRDEIKQVVDKAEALVKSVTFSGGYIIIPEANSGPIKFGSDVLNGTAYTVGSITMKVNILNSAAEKVGETEAGVQLGMSAIPKGNTRRIEVDIVNPDIKLPAGQYTATASALSFDGYDDNNNKVDLSIGAALEAVAYLNALIDSYGKYKEQIPDMLPKSFLQQ